MKRPLENLIRELTKLKGIGPKSAQRIAYDILESDEQKAVDIGNAIIDARKNVKKCSKCNDYTDVDPCNICTSPIRDASTICVVEYPKDVVAMEKTKSYNGLYYVLYGQINPSSGENREDLYLPKLYERIKSEDIKEVIIATSATPMGEVTAKLIAEDLKDSEAVVTRIGYGLPYGGEFEYFDPITIRTAITNRKRM